MKISFSLVQADEALSFWHKSPHATIFTHPEVLDHLSPRVDWWMAWKGEDPVCLWPACIRENKMHLPEFTYFVGPIWHGDAYSMPAHRWLAASTAVYEGYIKLMTSKYDQLEACLPVGLDDVRIFDWWNYHELDQPRFRIRARYTAIIDQLEEKSDNQIISGFRRNRRRELRAVKQESSLVSTADWKTEDLTRLYSENMAQQDIKIAESTGQQIANLVSLVEKGHGDVIAYKDCEQDEVIAAYLLLYGNGVANAVLSMVDADWRSSGVYAWMVFNSIKLSQTRGARIYDFNGANSPNRGDDKHSYGARPVLYFDLQFP